MSHQSTANPRHAVFWARCAMNPSVRCLSLNLYSTSCASMHPFVERASLCGSYCMTAGWGSSLCTEKGLAVECSGLQYCMHARTHRVSVIWDYLNWKAFHCKTTTRLTSHISWLLEVRAGWMDWVGSQTSHVGACRAQPSVGLCSADIALRYIAHARPFPPSLLLTHTHPKYPQHRILMISSLVTTVP